MLNFNRGYRLSRSSQIINAVKQDYAEYSMPSFADRSLQLYENDCITTNTAKRQHTIEKLNNVSKPLFRSKPRSPFCSNRRDYTCGPSFEDAQLKLYASIAPDVREKQTRGKRKRRPPNFFAEQQAEIDLLKLYASLAQQDEKLYPSIPHNEDDLTREVTSKRSKSRVGESYQVSHLPDQNHKTAAVPHETNYELISDSEIGTLTKHMLWSDSFQQSFHSHMIASRKNIPAIAKRMQIPIGSILQYYYGTYKSLVAYKAMKKMVQKKRKLASTKELQCSMCLKGGDILWCNGCENMYHLHCLDIPIKKKPVEEWYCSQCVLFGKFQKRCTSAKKSDTLVTESEGHGNKNDMYRLNKDMTTKKFPKCGRSINSQLDSVPILLIEECSATVKADIIPLYMREYDDISQNKKKSFCISKDMQSNEIISFGVEKQTRHRDKEAKIFCCKVASLVEEEEWVHTQSHCCSQKPAMIAKLVENIELVDPECSWLVHNIA